MNTLNRRVTRLEAEMHAFPADVLIWREDGETAAQAIQRHMAEHPDHQHRCPVVIGWRE